MARPKVTGREAQDFLEARASGDIAALVDALRDPELRAVAARRLGELHATEAVPQVRALLSASSSSVRTAAVRALGRMNAPAAVSDVERVVATDRDPVVREWALFSLGCLGAARLDGVAGRILVSPDTRLRCAAIAALLRSHDELASSRGAEARRSEKWRIRRQIDRVVKRIDAERAPESAV